MISEDINEIMKMGLFFDIKVWEKKLPSGAFIVRYELFELPTIFQVKIDGNNAFNEDEIKPSIAGLENYHIAKPSRLKEAAEKIKEFYVSKGYFLATVDVTTKKTKEADIKKREAEGLNSETSSGGAEIDTANVIAPDFVDVIFTEENSKVRINRISFVGNLHISDDLLKSSLRSQENHLLSIISDFGTFRKDYLEIDSLILEKIFHDRGYLKAKILTPEITISDDKTFINIEFRMIENEQYKLGAVSVTGDLVENNEVIYNLHKESKPDEVIFWAEKFALLN